ncbi:MAG: transketolase [Lachnospiraceae bacterium]
MADRGKNRLEQLAVKCRLNVLRMLEASKHGHLGGAFSCMDILTAIYFYHTNFDPKEPQKKDRDRFILSAGHKSMAQYAVLAEKGYFPKELLDTYGQLKSRLPGHPDMHKLPGVEANTGALGHGLSIAAGMALGMRLDRIDSKVYVIMGDGELCEGSNWEAAALAAHYNLDKLVVFVDYNGLQISGKVEEIMNMTPIDKHFEAFGWKVKNIDGNDMDEIISAMDSIPLERGKPSLFVAHTTKSKGLKKGEGKAAYHYWTPEPEELCDAKEDLLRSLAVLEGEEAVFHGN